MNINFREYVGLAGDPYLLITGQDENNMEFSELGNRIKKMVYK